MAREFPLGGRFIKRQNLFRHLDGWRTLFEQEKGEEKMAVRLLNKNDWEKLSDKNR